MSESWERRVRLLLAIQRALLGEVTPNIRAVTAQIDAQTILLRWIIDGEVSDSLRRDLSAVATEVVADFATHQIAGELIRCDASHVMDELYLDAVAYARKE
jgi:hypothetical protein